MMAKFKKYLDELKQSQEYKDFKDENPNAWLASGFFVLDYKSNNSQQQIDYFLPNKKIASFKFINNEDKKIQLQISDKPANKELPEIKEIPKIDLDELKTIVKKKMEKENVNGQLNEIIATVYILNNELTWNLQCILAGSQFFNIHIRDKDKKIKKFKKHSLKDLIKIK